MAGRVLERGSSYPGEYEECVGLLPGRVEGLVGIANDYNRISSRVWDVEALRSRLSILGVIGTGTGWRTNTGAGPGE